MRVIQSINNIDAILRMYKMVLSAPEVEIRDQRCRNVPNLAIVLDGRECPITNFAERKFNLNYCKKEWLWYLGADPTDDSIEEHATMWKKLRQPDGSYFSNYGQYIFNEAEGSSQFAYVVNMLRADKYTRRASMVLLQPHHLFTDNVDTVCTYAINFSIDGDYLNMTVMMRSNDVVFGFTNDAFCFWNLMEFVYLLVSRHYPGLMRGVYTHFTHSMHVYDRHYEMLQKIINSPNGDYSRVRIPQITAEEVVRLVKSRGKEIQGEYSTWLTT